MVTAARGLRGPGLWPFPDCPGECVAHITGGVTAPGTLLPHPLPGSHSRRCRGPWVASSSGLGVCLPSHLCPPGRGAAPLVPLLQATPCVGVPWASLEWSLKTCTHTRLGLPKLWVPGSHTRASGRSSASWTLSLPPASPRGPVPSGWTLAAGSGRTPALTVHLLFCTPRGEAGNWAPLQL